MQTSIYLILFLCSGIAQGSPLRSQSQDGVLDWISEIIETILECTPEEFLQLLDYTVRKLTILVYETSNHLKALILEADIDPDLSESLIKVIDEFLEESETIMHPIHKNFSIIIPAIQGQSEEEALKERMSLPDLLRALLGITLEEFLREIYYTLTQMASLLYETIGKLLDLVQGIGGHDREVIEGVIKGTLEEAEGNLKPILEKLAEVLPGIGYKK